MIYLGDHNQSEIVHEYITLNDIKNIYIIGDEIPNLNCYHVPYKESIMYKHYFKLLKEISKDSLIILNNILKSKNRSCLEYNCIRHYCNCTNNILAFQYYPIIDNKEDFLILYDMIQVNKFWKLKYEDIDKFENVVQGEINMSYEIKEIELSQLVVATYKELKEKTILEVKKDPDIIPRRLLKYSEKEIRRVSDFFDSLTERKPNLKLTKSQLPVDNYYFNQFLNFIKEVEDVRNKILK